MRSFFTLQTLGLCLVLAMAPLASGAEPATIDAQQQAAPSSSEVTASEQQRTTHTRIIKRQQQTADAQITETEKEQRQTNNGRAKSNDRVTKITEHDRVVVVKDEQGKRWQRERTRKDHHGRHERMEAQGEKIRQEDGSVVTHVERSGERRGGQKDTVNWEEAVDGVDRRNDLGGTDSIRQRSRTNSEGRSLEEERQRQSKTAENGKAFREHITREVNGEDVKIYREGRSTRQELKDGYVIQSTTKGRNDAGETWTKERQETIRHLDNGKRYRRVITALQTTNGKTTYTVEEGFYTELGNGQGWNYHGKVEKRDGKKVISTNQIERHFRNLPFADKHQS